MSSKLIKWDLLTAAQFSENHIAVKIPNLPKFITVNTANLIFQTLGA